MRRREGAGARRAPDRRGARVLRGAACLVLAIAALAPQALGSVDLEDEARRHRMLAERAEQFRDLIREAARRHGVDPVLVEALAAAESAFDPEAVSPVGAIGLMQVMPATAARLGCKDPFDPIANLEAGTRWLARLLTRYEGDRRLAIAAYNAGEGAVERAGGIPPYPETRRHVARVEAYVALSGGRTSEARRATGREAGPIVLAPSSPVSLPAPPPPSIRKFRDENGRLVFTNVGRGDR